MLVDAFHRKIDYLRLSVTDRCNLRCVYCLPESYSNFTALPEMLTDGEIVELLTSFAALGFSKVRITGGEPLVRPRLEDLVAAIAAIPGIRDISLSTNGMLLERHARELSRAGLRRINISLDSMDPVKFHEITRHGKIDTVMEGIEASLSCGLSPVKLNVVVARGMNEDEVGSFSALTESWPIHVRFIELMPMGETGFFSADKLVPMREILERAGPLESLPPSQWPIGHGPARYFRRTNGRGTVGIISALSCGFCEGCNRVRLSAKGLLVPCLDAAQGINLRTPLREGANRRDIQKLIATTVYNKPERHHMVERAAAAESNPRYMCQIGG